MLLAPSCGDGSDTAAGLPRPRHGQTPRIRQVRTHQHTVQYSTVQHSTVQYSTVQYSPTCHDVATHLELGVDGLEVPLGLVCLCVDCLISVVCRGRWWRAELSDIANTHWFILLWFLWSEYFNDYSVNTLAIKWMLSHVTWLLKSIKYNPNCSKEIKILKFLVVVSLRL